MVRAEKVDPYVQMLMVIEIGQLWCRYGCERGRARNEKRFVCGCVSGLELCILLKAGG